MTLWHHSRYFCNLFFFSERESQETLEYSFMDAEYMPVLCIFQFSNIMLNARIFLNFSTCCFGWVSFAIKISLWGRPKLLNLHTNMSVVGSMTILLVKLLQLGLMMVQTFTSNKQAFMNTNKNWAKIKGEKSSQTRQTRMLSLAFVFGLFLSLRTNSRALLDVALR